MEGRAVKRRGRRSAGFTLLELLVTLAVTTIGLIGLFSLHLSIARGNDGASRAAEATQIGNATIEQLRSARITDMVGQLTGNPNDLPPIDVTSFSAAISGSTGTVAGRAGMTYRRRVIVTALNSASASLWKIRVEVGWTEDGAAAGASGGAFDHLVSAEVIRTVEEAL
jgi:prepilin-type N-terminal cleavage/methylation domain-containing protein